MIQNFVTELFIYFYRHPSLDVAYVYFEIDALLETINFEYCYSSRFVSMGDIILYLFILSYSLWLLSQYT